jgi:transcription termination/antitermination protein NusG
MSDIETNDPTPDVPTDTDSDTDPDTAAEADEQPIIEPEVLDETVGDDADDPDEAPALEPETIDDEASAADADDVALPTDSESPEETVATAEGGVDRADGGSAEGAASTEAADEVVTGDELLEQQAAAVDNPFTRPGRWFVVHTQSGYEKKVKQNLEARIHSMNAEEAVYEVVIPMEDYVDFKNGKRVVSQRKMFPGYLLVRAELDDTAWFVIRNTPGVTGFVGQGAKPSPLPRRDVEAFLTPKGGEEHVATRAKPRLEYELGETVRVKEGPFADFSGEVIELNEDQLKLKVLVNIFGRETPVELEFSKVAKL